MTAREQILVVDDAATVRKVLRMMLEEAGYQVEDAATVQEAITAIDARSFDLIIVDKNLDGEDGFDVCRAAHEMVPDTARIVVTADQSVESAIRAVEEDIYAYMTKPLRKQEVLLRVRRALDRVRLTRERAEARAQLQAAKEALEKRKHELEQTLDQLLRAQTRLAESEELASVGMLAAGVAHEINNPTCFRLPHLEYLKRSAGNLGKAARQAGGDADKVEVEVAHIHRMVDRCLEGVTRIQKIVGTLQIFSRRDLDQPEPVDLNALCLSILDLVSHEMLGRAKLEVDLQPISAVTGRPKEVAQAVLNLLLVARRSIQSGTPAPDDHEIRLETEDRGEYVVLTVRDTGPPRTTPGSRGAQDFYFEEGRGQSLSLRLVREILDRSGGHLEMESTKDGNMLEAFFSLAPPEPT